MTRLLTSIWVDAARHSALPVAILLVIMLMVVPVSPVILDLGFIANIMVSLAVLMVALNVAKPLDFSAFPTVLLLATLFRLSLNVASTRVVLVDGHTGTAAAGHVIEAFGEALIGGDYVVGIFVFSVLMIINLVVITKGAGRVSEVSARFTLDALPGKQMAIDADLNAGLITPEDAKARRVEVATEADFYGSMDGASKFVKGDAFAGILILAINIVGGLVLGIVSHGLSLSEAASLYVVLAIGDALVAQVPALMLSIAAAAIVTRVTSPLDLSGQIASQFGNARAWLPVAGILLALGAVPSMPQLVVLPAAAAAGGIFWVLRHRDARARSVVPPPVRAGNPAEIGWNEVSETAPIILEIGYGLVDMVDERKDAPLMARITGIRRQLSRELGFVIPLVKVCDDLSLSANRYRIRIAGVLVGEDEVWPHELLALDSGDNPAAIAGRPVKDPSFGLDARWIAVADRADAIAAGYTVVDAPTVIATHLNSLISASAADLFGLDEALALIEALRETCPHLVQSIYPQPYSLAMVAGLCRGLLSERVALRDFRSIAEALAALSLTNGDAPELLEAVRQRLGPQIVQGIVPLGIPLPAFTFDPELERVLIDAVRTDRNAKWPFEPSLARQLTEALTSAVQPLMMAARSFAIITSPVCRAALSRLLRSQFGDVPVLSFLEIPERLHVEVISVIGAAPEPADLLPPHSAGD